MLIVSVLIALAGPVQKTTPPPCHACPPPIPSIDEMSRKAEHAESDADLAIRREDAQRQHEFFDDRSLLKAFGRALVDASRGGAAPSPGKMKQLRKQAESLANALPRIASYIGVAKLPKSAERVAKPIDITKDLIPTMHRLTDGLDQIARTPSVVDVALNQKLIAELQHLRGLLRNF